MKTSASITLGILTFLFSCQSPSTEQKSVDPPQKTEQTASPEVKLNNGQKWKANPETTEGVHNMLQLVNTFSEKENVTAYAELKKQLKGEMNLIFKNCTMKGKAHDQLHNYLIPMFDLIHNVGSEDLKECKSSYEQLNLHLNRYDEYFE